MKIANANNKYCWFKFGHWLTERAYYYWWDRYEPIEDEL